MSLASTNQRLMAWADWPLHQHESRNLLRQQGAGSIEQPFLATFQLPFSAAETLLVMRARAMAALEKEGPPGPRRSRHRAPQPALPAGGQLRVGISHTQPFKGSQVAPHYATMFDLWRSNTSLPTIMSLAQRLPPTESDGERWRAIEEEGRVQSLVEYPDDDAALARFCRGEHAPHVVVVSSAYGEADREPLFARRCAPVQTCWFDWPSSTGQSWIDYYVSDRNSIPAAPRGARAFSEKLALLPHSWYVTGHADWASAALEIDSARAAGSATAPAAASTEDDRAPRLEPWREGAVGRRGVVLANRNLAQKCDPETMDGWAAVLGRTAAESSSLWLYASPAEARERQYLELAARGVRMSRRRSSGKLPRADHILAMGRADLWLDTVSYNAHGTGTDVLWAPLPPVVLSGDKVASMSFSSMACVAGACVAGVRSRREYDDFAVALTLSGSGRHDKL